MRPLRFPSRFAHSARLGRHGSRRSRSQVGALKSCWLALRLRGKKETNTLKEKGSKEQSAVSSRVKSLQDSRVPIHRILLFARGKLLNLHSFHIGGTRVQSGTPWQSVDPFPFNNMTRTCLMALRRLDIRDMTLYSIPSHRVGHLLKAFPYLRTLRCGFLLRESNLKSTAHLFCPSKLSLTSLQVWTS